MPKRDVYIQHLSAVPMFSTCSKKELTMVARRGTDLVAKPGRVLARQGATGHEFFIIRRGEAEVSRDGRTVAKLGPGDFFGELALLDRTPRDATVTAITELDVIVVSGREFRALLEEAPNLTFKLLAGMAHRLHELEAPAGV